MAEHLHLLHLSERNLIADLNCLKPAYRRLVAEFKTLQACLLGLKVLGLSLGGRERSVQRVERGLRSCLRTLYARRVRGVVGRVELLELLRQALRRVRQAFLLVDQVSEIGEQVLI